MADNVEYLMVRHIEGKLLLDNHVETRLMYRESWRVIRTGVGRCRAQHDADLGSLNPTRAIARSTTSWMRACRYGATIQGSSGAEPLQRFTKVAFRGAIT